MRRTILPLVAFALLPLLCYGAAEKKHSPDAPGPFPKPADGGLWQHAASGVQLPHRLGDLEMEGGYRYDTPELGVSLRYTNPESRTRADIYVYLCSKTHGNDAEILKAATDEAGAVLGEIEYMEKQGHYQKVTHGNADSYEVAINGTRNAPFLEFPITYEILDTQGKGKSASAVVSRAGLTVLGDHFVKARYTYPADQETEGEARCTAWFKKLRVLLSDPYLRSVAETGIKTYRKEPLTEAGRDAAANVLTYAEASPMVSIVILSELSEWGEVCEKAAPGARLDLMRAYVVGSVERSLQGGTPAEIMEEAMRSTVHVYKELKRSHGTIQVEALETWVDPALPKSN